MSINKLFLISIFINICMLQDPPQVIPELTCGKKTVDEEKDCTKYGTGSGMLCCWIAGTKEEKGECYLIPQDLAENAGINGEKYFETTTTTTTTNYKYFSCGNKSSYLNYNIIMILLAIFVL